MIVLIDTHCHLLPGFDDGPGTEKETMAMAAAAVEEGIRAIVATPHYITGLYEPGPERIRRAVSGLQAELVRRGIPLEVYPGCEVLLEPDIALRVREGKLLPLGGRSRYVLLELPATEIPSWADTALYQIQLAGFVPVIAHPERNGEVRRRSYWLEGLIERGVLVQLTAASLTGHFGSRVQEQAWRMLREGQVHLMATDAHSPGGRTMKLSAARHEVGRILSDEALDWLFYDNPKRILEDCPPVPFNGRWLKRKWFRVLFDRVLGS